MWLLPARVKVQESRQSGCKNYVRLIQQSPSHELSRDKSKGSFQYRCRESRRRHTRCSAWQELFPVQEASATLSARTFAGKDTSVSRLVIGEQSISFVSGSTAQFLTIDSACKTQHQYKASGTPTKREKTLRYQGRINLGDWSRLTGDNDGQTEACNLGEMH